MTTLTESSRTGSFLLSEANGNRSREEITVITGQDLPAGAVLGKITASGKYTAVSQGAGDGSQTAVAVLWQATDATDADVKAAAIVRDAEVNREEMDFGGESTTEIETAITELAAVGIIVRDNPGHL